MPFLRRKGKYWNLVEGKRDPDTKKVKQKVSRVQIPEMASIIRGIARGTIQWADDPNWDTQIPSFVEGCDYSRFDLDKFYTQDQIEYLVGELRLDRREYIEKFPGLEKSIYDAVEL